MSAELMEFGQASLKESYKLVIFVLFKPSFSRNNDGPDFPPANKSLEHFLLRLYLVRATKRIYYFFLIFNSYFIDQLLFKSSMGKESIDSIVRAQVAALSDAALCQV